MQQLGPTGSIAVQDEEGLVVLQVGLLVTLYFEGGSTQPVREAVAACFEEYRTMCGPHLRWAQPSRRGFQRLDKRPDVDPAQWLRDQSKQQEFEERGWEFYWHGGRTKEEASHFRVFAIAGAGSEEDGIDHLSAALPGAVLSILGSRGAEDTWGLERFLVHGEPGVRCAALRASLCQLQHVRGQWLIPSLTASTREVRVAALEAGLAVGLRLAWEVCQQEARAGNPHAMVLLAVGGGEGEVAALRELLSAPRLRAHALWALGFTGRASAAEACLGFMEDKALAPLAAESFCAITGLELEGAYALPRPELAEEPPPLEEDDLDADLTPRPEEALPLPEAREVAAWWLRERTRFEQGRRYLRGRPYEPGVLLNALVSEPMRRRHVLASELLIRSRGTCLIPTRALTWRQRAALQQSARAAQPLPMAPFDQLTTL